MKREVEMVWSGQLAGDRAGQASESERGERGEGEEREEFRVKL